MPRATCLMPTRNRRAFVRIGIELFRRQTFRDVELLIVDDGDDPVADIATGDERIRYIRLPSRLNIGAKRNLGCREARGESIVHWDDDDWSGPERVAQQVAALDGSGADICGLDSLIYWDPAADRAWRYTYPLNRKPWVAGNTLCYRRSFWERMPFPEIQIGEDARFVWQARPGQVARVNDDRFFVGLAHSDNTSPKRTDSALWLPVELETVMQRLGTDAAMFREALGARPKGVALVAAARGIGDILRTTPLIRAFARMGYAVDVLLRPDYPDTISLIEGAPEVRRVLRHPDALATYDVAAFTHWAACLAVQVRAKQKFSFQRSHWLQSGDSASVERIARDAGWKGAMPEPFAVSSSRRFDLPPDTVAIHAGCKETWFWKKWHGFDDLASRFESVALVGTPSDLANGSTYFRREFVWPSRVQDFVGKLNLPDTAALLRQCAAMVSNDSGLMHLAVAVGTPTFGVFGITSPTREAMPARKMFPVTKGLSCEPACHAGPWGRRDCNRHLECLRTLTVGEVAARVAPALRQQTQAPSPVEALAIEPLSSTWFDADYFEHGIKSNWKGGYTWESFGGLFRETAQFLVEMFPEARTFYDAGCAKGFLVKSLRESGRDAWGGDFSAWALDHADEPAKPFLDKVDVVCGVRRSDVLVALHLLPHLTEPQVDAFLAIARENTTQAMVAVIVTYEHPGDRPAGDLGHITRRPLPWWRERFVRAGWRQDPLHECFEVACQRHALPRRMNWTMCVYAP